VDGAAFGTFDYKINGKNRRRLRPSARIVEAEHAGRLVIGEGFGVASPGRNGVQGLVGVLLGHVVLELVTEAAGRRAMGGALVEHAPDVSGKRHVGQEMLGEQPLAVVGIEIDEAAAGVGEPEVAFGQLGEDEVPWSSSRPGRLTHSKQPVISRKSAIGYPPR
jgi:hypothetical protein